MLLFKQQSYDIIGAAMSVYNTLGPGFLEPVYQEALEIEFKRRNIPYEREKEIKIYYDGIELSKTYRADFVIYGNVIVELKAVSCLDDGNRAQLINYLKATNMKLGLLLNFGNYKGLEYERRVH